MSLETIAAKKGIELSAKAIKTVVFIALIGAVCTLSWCTADHVATLRTENEGLKEYKAKVERREALGQTATAAHQTAQVEATAQEQRQTETAVIHDRATQEAANEDPSSASFLRAPIPERLRRADREARQARAPDGDR